MAPQPPSSLPPGSWGGDADPNTSARRAQFEADLQRQTAARQAALAGQPPVVGQPIVGSAPPPKPPMEGGLYIPPDLGAQGDLISSMAEEELRSSNDVRRAAGMPVEQPPKPEPMPTPAPAPAPTSAHPTAAPTGAVTDAVQVLQQIALAIEAGLPAMIRATAARVAQGKPLATNKADLLAAASELVTAVVKSMST